LGEKFFVMTLILRYSTIRLNIHSTFLFKYSLRTFIMHSTSLFAVILAAVLYVILTPVSADAPLPEVGIMVLERRDVILTTELPGRIVPSLIAEVRPRVSGIVEERLFTEGSHIKRGQLLYRLDAALYHAAHNSAKAALARDEAALSTAKLKADRYKRLIGSKAISQEAHDDAQAELAEARAVVEVSRAALKTAEINLEYTRITAPIAGRIGRSAVTPGALVTANQNQVLAIIQQLDPIYVDLSQSSAQLLRLRHALASGTLERSATDVTVTLILEDGRRYDHSGVLQFSEAMVNESTGTVTLRAQFPNPEQELLPGMYVRAIVQEGTRKNAILVPQRAVSRNPQGQATALILDAEDTVMQRILSTERAIGNEWLITGGVHADERLIVDGLQKVRPGGKARAAIVERKE
jgi:membrane fusion protein, multidrug efflux system